MGASFDGAENTFFARLSGEQNFFNVVIHTYSPNIARAPNHISVIFGKKKFFW
jgi:hypothetical protein